MLSLLFVCLCVVQVGGWSISWPSSHVYDVVSVSDGFVAVGSTNASIGGQNAGLEDILITFYQTSSNLTGQTQFGTAGMDVANAVVSYSFNCLYLTGYYAYRSNATFDSAFLGTFCFDGNGLTLKPLIASSTQEGRAVAFRGVTVVVTGWTADDSGVRNTVLFRGLDTSPQILTFSFHNSGEAVVIHEYAGFVYVVGYTEGSMCDSCIFSGDTDMFLAVFNTDRTPPKVYQWGTPYQDAATSLYLAGSMLYIGGYMTASFANQTFHGVADGVLIAFDTDSNTMKWLRMLGTADWDHVSAVSASPDGSQIWVTGMTYGSLDEQTYVGKGDSFLSAWTPAGQWQWTIEWGTEQTDRPYALDSGVVVGVGNGSAWMTTVTCAPGSVHQQASVDCVPCPTGFRCPDPQLYPSGFPCPPGSASTRGASVCSPCPDGYECPTPQNSSSMQPCAPGSFAPANATECVSCPRNTFQNVSMATECEHCPHGMISAVGSVNCTMGSSDSTSPSPAVIAAIVCGCVGGLAMVAAVGYWWKRRAPPVVLSDDSDNPLLE